MAGRIKREDVESVRERARIEEVVGERVTLKAAGSGSMKGLCPFHDERTPSFQVRPQFGLWHCFGCGEGGDVISFVQKADSLGFAEAVEYLAGRYGVELHYETGGRPQGGMETSGRARLMEANRLAAQFYGERLAAAEAEPGRAFLRERGFDRTAADHFGIGYAPEGWDNLLRHLRGNGFTEAEIGAAGLVSQGQRGFYDRFRGRLVWPIRDLTGAVIGFGARKLFEADQGPKYLNTPETPVYHKSQTLYGADLAKREIARSRQVVVVEGYTDVMAAHMAGVPTAIATCGTAFGADHIRVVRRLLGDAGDAATGVMTADGQARGGQVIFTFDGDAAGQKAAMRAFAEDQRFYAQTFVAIAPDGMDPCELRQAKGDQAVRSLVAGRVPLFRFALRTALAQLDLDTAEGRVAGLRIAAPIVAGIRDLGLRGEYARLLAGWLGMDEPTVIRGVKQAMMAPRGRREAPDGPPGEPPPRTPAPVGRGAARADPVARAERDALTAVLQAPEMVQADFDELEPDTFSVPQYRAVHDAIRAVGGVGAARGETGRWLEAVREMAARPVAGVVTELAVQPLPITEPSAAALLADPDGADRKRDYVRGVIGHLLDQGVTRQIALLRGRLNRLDATQKDQQQALLAELMRLEARKRELRPDE